MANPLTEYLLLHPIIDNTNAKTSAIIPNIGEKQGIINNPNNAKINPKSPNNPLFFSISNSFFLLFQFRVNKFQEPQEVQSISHNCLH